MAIRFENKVCVVTGRSSGIGRATVLQLIQEGDWRGFVIGAFVLVWIANIYMSLFGLIQQGMKKEKTEIKLMEQKN